MIEHVRGMGCGGERRGLVHGLIELVNGSTQLISGCESK